MLWNYYFCTRIFYCLCLCDLLLVDLTAYFSTVPGNILCGCFLRTISSVCITSSLWHTMKKGPPTDFFCSFNASYTQQIGGLALWHIKGGPLVGLKLTHLFLQRAFSLPFWSFVLSFTNFPDKHRNTMFLCVIISMTQPECEIFISYAL